ncbi:hypothetical protein Ahy_A07g033429 [Arachis hypogaea]|uniref:Uncharacterized protein n=1 Tax=Arachis hypogaea TaxID=3818 RepID=A0A445C9C9_ARAHY|nr:hypothetical protein Ahy_A07g033429 [Arachis hypogaea]
MILDIAAISLNVAIAFAVMKKMSSQQHNHKKIRPKKYANNWLTVKTYNKTYEFLIQPISGKKFQKKHGYANILSPAYKRASKRPTMKGNKMSDAPEPQLDPHRVKQKYRQLVCKYCLSV